MRNLFQAEKAPMVAGPEDIVDLGWWQRQPENHKRMRREQNRRRVLRADMLAILGAREEDLYKRNSEGRQAFAERRRVFSTADALDMTGKPHAIFQFSATPEMVEMLVTKQNPRTGRRKIFGFHLADWSPHQLVPARLEKRECLNWAVGSRIVDWSAVTDEFPYILAREAEQMLAESLYFLHTNSDVHEVVPDEAYRPSSNIVNFML